MKLSLTALVNNNFTLTTYSSGVQSTCSIWQQVTTCVNWTSIVLVTFPEMPWWAFSLFRVNKKQKSREVAITASTFISRSKESRVSNKHTLHFFAAWGDFRWNKLLLQSQNYTIHWPWTCTCFQLFRTSMWNFAQIHTCICSVNTASVTHKCMHIHSGKQSWESKNQTMTC